MITPNSPTGNSNCRQPGEMSVALQSSLADTIPLVPEGRN